MGDIVAEAVGFPYRSHFGSEIGGALEATTEYTTVTSGAANTKGSWTQLLAATAEDSAAMLLAFTYPGVMFGIDLGVGAAASETVLVPNIYVGCPGNALPHAILIPVFVKKGTRITARLQDSAGGNSMTLAVIMLKTPVSAQMLPLNTWPSIGPTIGESAGYLTSSSVGTTLTASASANTKGSYAQLIASTAKRSVCMLVFMGNTVIDQKFFIDIATGAAASEVVLVSDLFIWYSSDQITPVTIPIMIPPGTRIAARCQCNLAGSKTIKACITLLEVT
jgi:hypothetical protein